MYANRVSLTGFLGKDAETKTTRNNASFTVLSLATKRSWKDRETGERQSQTTWHRIIAWSKLAEYAASLTKGAHLQIDAITQQPLLPWRKVVDTCIAGIRAAFKHSDRPGQQMFASAQTGMS